MIEDKEPAPICPCCRKPIESLLNFFVPVTLVPSKNASPMDKFDKSPIEPVAVYACPSCRTVLSVAGGHASYIGSINFGDLGQEK